MAMYLIQISNMSLEEMDSSLHMELQELGFTQAMITMTK